ncbi:glycosyltransferase [Pseudacidovorax intermedius]|uniref:glycosyltransferase family 2 protein n=1 Tax=Pseudacidovorax intermedius TaxID=433924 RepID=UPI0026EB048F|nr:glycosyltransferase [Pseudacidovorax intermedius]
MAPKVSVLIPAYNAEKYIRESLQSILFQSFKDLEIILVNDGSVDRTFELASDLAASDARLKVYSVPNSGIVNALNQGLRHCSGEYIARMDADDIAHPDRLKLQYEFMADNPHCAALGSWYEQFGEKSGIKKYPRSNIGCQAMLFFEPCFGHPSVMMKRSALARLGEKPYNIDFEYAEDYALWCSLARIGSLGNSAAPLLRYRTHPNQIASRKAEQQQSAHLAIAVKKWKEYGVHMSPDSLRQIIWGRGISYSLITTTFRLSLSAASIRISPRIKLLLIVRVWFYFFKCCARSGF